MLFGWFKSKDKKDTEDQQKKVNPAEEQKEQEQRSQEREEESQRIDSEEFIPQLTLDKLRKAVNQLDESPDFLDELKFAVTCLELRHSELSILKSKQSIVQSDVEDLEEQDEEDYDGNFDFDLSNRKIRAYQELQDLASQINSLEERVNSVATELLNFVNLFIGHTLHQNVNNSSDNFDSFEYFKTIGTLIYLKEKGYLKVLARKTNQLIYFDEYGDMRAEKFFAELDKFASRRDLNEVNEHITDLMPEGIRDILISLDVMLSPVDKNWRLLYLTTDEDEFAEEYARGLNGIGMNDFKQRVSQLLLEEYSKHSTSDANGEEESDSNSTLTDTTISPYEYEGEIGEKFKILGWKTLVTKASGDQGADVIIEKGEHRGVVQCKMYSQPVGNKAVQEVHAAKSYYDATFAVVVSNQDFTSSARMLATKLGVYLINDSDLRNFSELF